MASVTEHRRYHTMHHAYVETTWGEAVTALAVLGQADRHVSAGGRIIAFSSSVVAKAFPTYCPYIASKAGV
jgi:NAD(P)-dependent dehydrogenase (short-subunit alcohol dehydrogenase family)